MKPTEPPEPLSRLLRQWSVQPARDPGFRAAVWHRMRRGSHESWASYLRQHLAAWALAAIAVSAAAGWSGRTVAHSRLKAERETMVVNYLVGLDPRVQAKLQH